MVRPLHDLNDTPEGMSITLHNEGHGVPLLASAPCSPDTVHVVFGVAGGIIIHNEGHPFDVETASGNIRGHQEFKPPFL